MPFGLTNVHAGFQRLIRKVLVGLNPEDGSKFVTVHINHILVFSPTLQEHLEHLQRVIDCLWGVNLKLNPLKCRFVREKVSYLGHAIMVGGVKPNPRLSSCTFSAVETSVPTSRECARSPKTPGYVVLPQVPSELCESCSHFASVNSQGCPICLDTRVHGCLPFAEISFGYPSCTSVPLFWQRLYA